MMKKVITFQVLTIFIGVLLLGGAIGFAEGPKPEYYVDESKLPFDALPDVDKTVRYWGIHKGAGYRVEVPKNWNGDLVVYCHGDEGDGLELTVSNPRIRAFLIDMGYAWAASSYTKNAYAVKEGVKDTHSLAMFFNGLVGKPNRIYITGHSMGGHITAVSIEQYPKVYDGALPMCGVMGDLKLFDYFQEFHLIAQWATGIAVDVPFPENYETDILPTIKFALGGPPVGYPFTFSDAGETFRNAIKYLSGGERPLYNSSFMMWVDFVFGMIMDPDIIGNMDTIYQLDGDPELSDDELALNDEIYRSEPLPKTRHPNGMGNIPVISGEISIPVLSLHTLGDLYVPFSMQQIYAERVAANGKSNLLVQRAIRDIGHCYFDISEEEAAFFDLVNWVEDGKRANGDDILDPGAVADPDFGCEFTLVQHPPYWGVPITPCSQP